MALTATATQGYEFDRYVAPNEVLWLPVDPGDTIARGDLVSVNADQTSGADDGEGLLDIGAADDTWFVGVALESRTAPAATTVGFPKLGDEAHWGDVPGNLVNTLVPVIPFVPVGTPVFKCTFKNQVDDTAAAYNASTPSLTGTAALGADDDGNGALIYVN